MSENYAQFHGAWCPTITPFDDQGNIDFTALQQHLQRLEEAGTHVILLMGSIGEFTALTLDERLMLIHKAREITQLTMVANISTTCVADMLLLEQEAKDCGYQAVMILPHYYFSANAGAVAGVLSPIGATFAR